MAPPPWEKAQSVSTAAAETNADAPAAISTPPAICPRETVKEDGSSLDLDPEKSFAKAHYEQHMQADGSFTVLNPPFRLSGSDCTARPFVARPGEHTEAILGGRSA